jgi:hypothetical protein
MVTVALRRDKWSSDVFVESLRSGLDPVLAGKNANTTENGAASMKGGLLSLSSTILVREAWDRVETPR